MIDYIASHARLTKFLMLAIWPIDWFLVMITLRGRSWRVSNNRGLRKMLGMPMLTWINYYQEQICGKQSTWMGHRVLKNPMDAWVYQEILYEVKPDIIIEIGNKNGGSTLFLAGLCDLIGHGRVLAVDIDHSQFDVSHPRIDFITGDSGSDSVVEQVKDHCKDQKVLIIHDGDHTREAVLKDLRNYSGLVAVDSYFIVEDSIIGIPGFHYSHSRRVSPFLIPRRNNPVHAVNEFLRENHSFVADDSCEKHIFTYNPGGFLRRTS